MTAIEGWLTTVDPSIVGVAFGMAGLVMSVVIALLGRVGERSRSLSWWVGAAVCITLGFLINVLQFVLPHRVVVLIANPLTVTGACLFLVGVRILLKRPPALVQLAPLIVVSVVTSILFAVAWPNVVGRVLSQALCLLVVTVMNMLLLRELDDRHYRFPARLLIVTNAFLTFIVVLRAGAVIVSGGPVVGLMSSTTGALLYAAIGLIVLAYLAGILLLCFAEEQILLIKLATEDSLTGALNRRGLRDALDVWPQGQSGVATMFDIDHFKRFNDQFGHEAGDVVLKKFVRTLYATGPKGAIVVRMGGDEFCVVETAEMRAANPGWIEALKLQLSTATRLAPNASSADACNASHGSGQFHTVAGGFSEALRLADQALYRSKAARAPAATEA